MNVSVCALHVLTLVNRTMCSMCSVTLVTFLCTLALRTCATKANGIKLSVLAASFARSFHT